MKRERPSRQGDLQTGKAASIARSAGMMSSPMYDGLVAPRSRHVDQHAVHIKWRKVSNG